MAHWGDSYFGELYLETVADLLGPGLSAVEAEAIAALLRTRSEDRILDLACGHGRHAHLLSPTVRAVVGVDRSAAYLRLAAARPGVGLVRGDLRALPFRSSAFDAAFSWYSSLFMFDDATNEACLAEAARVVRPGGRILVQHGNPMRLALEPVAEARRILPDGSVVEERSVFDLPRGVDRCARRLVRPGGAVLAGTAELRYYMPLEWRRLADRAGLLLAALTTTPDAARARHGEPGSEAPDIIALLEKPT